MSRQHSRSSQAKEGHNRFARAMAAASLLSVLLLGVVAGMLERRPSTAASQPEAAEIAGPRSNLGTARAELVPDALVEPRNLTDLTGPLPIELPRTRGAEAAALTPSESKALTKLAKKHAKQTAKVASLDALLAEAQAQLAAAQAALADAEASEPITIWEWLAKDKALKAAKKAVKKWTKAVAKYSKKLDKAENSLLGLVAAIEELDPYYFESSTSDDDPPPGDVAIPVLLQEALWNGAQGVDRIGAVASFGLPFHQAQGIAVIDGRPQLGLSGADRWQFEPLAVWPDGSVRWALLSVQGDVAAGGQNVGLVVTEGDGSSNQAPLASQNASTVAIDTGPLQATVSKVAFNLFRTVTVDGVQLVDSAEPGITARSTEGALLTPSAATAVVIEENGPARAIVRATGAMATAGGTDVFDFTCRIIARAGARELEVQFTVRNANFARQKHLVVEGIELSVAGSLGTNRTVSMSLHDGTHESSLSSGSEAYLFVGRTEAPVEGFGTEDGPYLPHLPVDGNDNYVLQGYEAVSGGTVLKAFGNKNNYPEFPWVDLTGSKGGITVAVQYLTRLYPGSVEADGTGRVAAGIFTDRNPAPYVFNWRQHESRTAVFAFHAGDPVTPVNVPKRVDWPFTGRALDYLTYDAARVLPYRLVSVEEANAAFDAMGLGFHEVETPNTDFKMTRYLYAASSGGTNNHARVEKLLGGEWLRFGHGGPYLTGMDIALYKSEWQIKRSDGFHSKNAGQPTNSAEVDVSFGHFGDDEHRYRDGIVLAYCLGGDRRIRDALLDECEFLQSISLWPHERSMYQTLRAMSYVAEFVTTVAPLLETQGQIDFATAQVELLNDILRDRLEYITVPTINISTTSNGFGWQSTPGNGSRRYFVNSNDAKDEKPPGENFQTRGFVTGTFGPIAYYHAARWLETLAEWRGEEDPEFDELLDESERARLRMMDLSYFCREELYPYNPIPANRWLVYSYAVTLQQWVKKESSDFHPIHLGMAASAVDPLAGSASERQKYIQRGIEAFEACAAHDNGPYDDNLYVFDNRLDVQHFLRIYLDSLD